MRYSLLFLIMAFPAMIYCQDATQTGFFGTFDFSGMAAGGTSDFQGDIINFSDQTNQYFASGIAVGDVVWDNLGNRFEVMVVNSSTLLQANIDIRDINASGSPPFGRGCVSRESATAGLTLIPTANLLGISDQLLARIQSHNSILTDNWMAANGGGGSGYNPLLDTLTQASGTFALLEPGYIDATGNFVSIKNTSDAVSATVVIHDIPDASTIVVASGGFFDNPNTGVTSNVYYQADHTATGYSTTPDTARKLAFIITGAGNEFVQYFATEATGPAVIPTVDSSKWEFNGLDIQPKGTANVIIKDNEYIHAWPGLTSGGTAYRIGTLNTGMGLTDVNDLSFFIAGTNILSLDASTFSLRGGAGAGDSWELSYNGTGSAGVDLHPDRNNQGNGFGGGGGSANLINNNAITLTSTTANSIGIGTANNTTDATAILELSSTTKGFLNSRLTTAQRTAIGTPANYLSLFDSDLQAPFFNDPTNGWWNHKNGTYQRADTSFFQLTTDGSWFHEGELFLDSPTSFRAGIANNFAGRFRGVFLSGPGSGESRNLTIYYGDEDGRFKILGTRAGTGNEYLHWFSGFRSTMSIGSIDPSASGFGNGNYASLSLFPNANTQGNANNILRVYDGSLLADLVWTVTTSTGTTINATQANNHDFKVNGGTITNALHVDTDQDITIFNGHVDIDAAFYDSPKTVTTTGVGSSDDFHVLLDASSGALDYQFPNAGAGDVGRWLRVTFIDNTNANGISTSGDDVFQLSGGMTTTDISSNAVGQSLHFQCISTTQWLLASSNFDHNTGWEVVQRLDLSQAAPTAIAAGDSIALDFTTGTVIRTDLPVGIDSLWNRTTDRLTAQLGAGIDLRIDLDVRSGTTDNYFVLKLDIDGTQDIIVERTISLPRGANVWHPISVAFPAFQLSDFVANGGEFRVEAANNAIDVAYPTIFVKKDYSR